jgi:hypothetical protein
VFQISLDAIGAGSVVETQVLTESIPA